MCKYFSPAEFSPRPHEMIPPDEPVVLEYVGRYAIVAYRGHLWAEDDDGESPTLWQVDRADSVLLRQGLTCGHAIAWQGRYVATRTETLCMACARAREEG